MLGSHTVSRYLKSHGGNLPDFVVIKTPEKQTNKQTNKKSSRNLRGVEVTVLIKNSGEKQLQDDGSVVISKELCRFVNTPHNALKTRLRAPRPSHIPGNTKRPAGCVKRLHPVSFKPRQQTLQGQNEDDIKSTAVSPAVTNPQQKNDASQINIHEWSQLTTHDQRSKRLCLITTKASLG